MPWQGEGKNKLLANQVLYHYPPLQLPPPPPFFKEEDEENISKSNAILNHVEFLYFGHGQNQL